MGAEGSDHASFRSNSDISTLTSERDTQRYFINLSNIPKSISSIFFQHSEYTCKNIVNEKLI